MIGNSKPAVTGPGTEEPPAHAQVPYRDPFSTAARGHRVLMLAPTSFFADYGCHVRILEEAEVLQRLGHQVTIATYHSGNPVPGLDIRRTLPIPWRRHYLVGSSRHKLAYDALLGLKTVELLARGRFDVIHAHLHEGALIGLVLGRLFRVPTVFDFQGSLTAEMLDHRFLRRDSRFYFLVQRLERRIDRSAPVVFTSSAHAQRLLVDSFDCDPARVKTLPDAVNGDTFRPASSYRPAELAALRASLGIPADRRLIVYLGLLAEYQGTGLLLEAMQRIVQRRQDAHLLLMGFPNEDLYRSRAAALGISDFVTLTGRVPYQRAAEHLALGDVAVSAKMSLTEGAGKLLNYMAVGLPTVTFDTPVAREYLGPDGIFAPAGDVAALCDRLHDCLFPPEGLAGLGRSTGLRLRRRAIQNYRWEAVGQRITEVYDELSSLRHRTVARDASCTRKGQAPAGPTTGER